MSVLLYGGTFDPLHCAHLRLAWEASEQLQPDTVHLLPAAVPPHRPQPLADAPTRLRWLQMALTGVPGFRADARELHRPGPSYTVDTLREWRAEIGPEQPLIWLIGADALGGLARWHQADQLFELAHFAVLRRPGVPAEAALRQQYATRACAPTALRSRPAGGVCWLDNSVLDISATALRQRLANGGSARFLVPESIRAEVDAYPGYRCPNAPAA